MPESERSYLIWPGGGDPGISHGSLEMRRRVAAAMLAQKRGYPKNLGEGLTALGEGIPLFAGLRDRADFTVQDVRRWGPGFVQLHLTTQKI